MKIKGSFDYSDNFSLKFINGAFGGPTSDNNNIVMNFYFENLELPKKYELNVGDDGNITESVIGAENIEVNRKVESGIIMNLDTAKSIHKWLEDTIKSLEQSNKEE